MKLFSNYLLLLLMGTLFYQRSNAAATKHSFKLTVINPLPVEDDSLFLLVDVSFFRENNGEEKVYAVHSSGQGRYVFQVDADAPYGRFSVMQKPPVGNTFRGRQPYIPLLVGYFWQAGDDVTVTVSRRHPNNRLTGLPDFDYQKSYSGTGFEKYVVEDQLDSAYNVNPDYQQAFWIDTTHSSYHDPYFFQINSSLQVLDAARARIPAFFYQLRKADAISASYSITSYFFYLKTRYDQLHDNKLGKEHFLEAYSRSMANRLAIPVSQDALAASSKFVEFIYQKINFDNYIQYGYENADANFKTITAHYTGALRDRILVKALLSDQGSEHVDTLYQYAASLIRDSVSLRVLHQLRGRMPGLAAYDFKLQDTKGNYHRLSDYKGKTVFIDMWFTGCGACTVVYKDVVKQAEEDLHGNPDVQFISICVDTGKKVWMDSIKGGEYTSDLATNLYTNGQGFRHEMMQYYGINSLPKLMIIRPDGKVYKFYHTRMAKDLESAGTLVKTLKAAGGK